MQTEVVIAAALLFAIVVVGLVVATRKRLNRPNPPTSTRTSGPANLHFVCAGCSAQVTHSRRTIGAWEKGYPPVLLQQLPHRVAQQATPARYSDQPALQAQSEKRTPSRSPGAASTSSARQAPRSGLAPARSGCFTVIVVLVAIPTAIAFVAAYA